MVTNIVTNAIKYSPDGGNVVIAAVGNKKGITVSVKDEGIGIPEALQAKVFDRFFRVNNVQMSTIQGMGLGLYISSEIIERHGGKLALESKVNKGSVFYFTIPYAGQNGTN